MTTQKVKSMSNTIRQKKKKTELNSFARAG